MKTYSQCVILIMALTSISVLAEDPKVDRALERNVNQQERIEQGLQSGELNTKEAARLEHEQGHIDSLEARALKDGTLTTTEATRIRHAQQKASADIYAQKHDQQEGNPNSLSSRRMQADVQRNANQAKRIQAGVESGKLTEGEVARLQAGQAHVARQEARAGADGHVDAVEQKRMRQSENRQSRKVNHKKHNANKD